MEGGENAILIHGGSLKRYDLFFSHKMDIYIYIYKY